MNTFELIVICVLAAMAMDFLLKDVDDRPVFRRMNRVPKITKLGPGYWQADNFSLRTDSEGLVHVRRLNTLEEVGTWKSSTDALYEMQEKGMFNAK